jgi:hypothetical protein
MPNVAMLILATILLFGSLEVWAGGSRTAATDQAPTFVISNAL